MRLVLGSEPRRQQVRQARRVRLTSRERPLVIFIIVIFCETNTNRSDVALSMLLLLNRVSYDDVQQVSRIYGEPGFCLLYRCIRGECAPRTSSDVEMLRTCAGHAGQQETIKSLLPFCTRLITPDNLKADRDDAALARPPLQVQAGVGSKII